MESNIKFYDTIFSTPSVFASDIKKANDIDLFKVYEGKVIDFYTPKGSDEKIYLVEYIKGNILVPDNLIVNV